MKGPLCAAVCLCIAVTCTHAQTVDSTIDKLTNFPSKLLDATDEAAAYDRQSLFGHIDPGMNTVEGVHASMQYSTLPTTSQSIHTVSAISDAIKLNNTLQFQKAANLYNQAIRVNGTTYY
jgi:hypothetical protein